MALVVEAAPGEVFSEKEGDPVRQANNNEGASDGDVKIGIGHSGEELSRY